MKFRWFDHIYIIVKYLFSRIEDLYENVEETTVLACEIFTFGFRPWLKNVAYLSSLMAAPLLFRYVRFHLAFYNENNVLVTHPLFTARHYLR